MKTLQTVLSVLFVIVIAQSAFGQSPRETVKQAAIDIASGNATKDAKSNRQAALRWTIETEEITLIACGPTFGPFVDKKNKNGSEMTEAYMIGMAAYKIENPTADENAVQQAGVELALKVYDRLTDAKPKTKFKHVDELITKRENGELAAFVAEAHCGKK